MSKSYSFECFFSMFKFLCLHFQFRCYMLLSFPCMQFRQESNKDKFGYMHLTGTLSVSREPSSSAQHSEGVKYVALLYFKVQWHTTLQTSFRLRWTCILQNHNSAQTPGVRDNRLRNTVLLDPLRRQCEQLFSITLKIQLKPKQLIQSGNHISQAYMVPQLQGQLTQHTTSDLYSCFILENHDKNWTKTPLY